MKALRTLGLLFALLIPTVAIADATGDITSCCDGGGCCPACDHCPFHK